MMKQTNDIDKLFKEGLGNLELTPNPLVKQQVQKKMLWINFFKKFGVYVFLFFLFIGIVGLFSFNNTNGNLLAINTEKSDVTNQTSTINNADNTKFNTEQIKNQKSINDISINVKNNIKITEENIKESNKDVNKHQNKILLSQELNAPNFETKQAKTTPLAPKENEINNANKVLNKNAEIATLRNKEIGENTNKSTENNLSSKNNKNQYLDKVLKAKSTKEISQKLSNVQETTKNNKKTEQVLLAKNKFSTKSNINSINSTAQEIVQKTSSTQAIFKMDMQLKQELSDQQQINFMPTKECLKLPQKIVLPKMPDDTVGMDIYHKPIIFPSHRWSLSFYIAPNYSFVNTEVFAEENKTLAELNQTALSPLFSYGLGLSTSYQFKQLALEGGFSFMQYMQNFETIEQKLTINNISYWETYQKQEWKVDSTAYINIDSIFQGDTVLIYKKDSISYFVNDSLLKNRDDSIWNDSEVSQQNIYRYIEIPLFVTYNFNRGASWQPFVGIGLVSGIYLKTQTYYLSSDKIVSIEDLPFAKFHFWAGINTGIRYRYNDKISFYTAIHYRYQLNNLFDKPKYYQQRLNNLQWHWGISYQF